MLIILLAFAWRLIGIAFAVYLLVESFLAKDHFQGIVLLVLAILLVNVDGVNQ